MTTDGTQTPFSARFTPADVICRTEVTDRDQLLLSLLRRMAQRREIGDVEEAHRAVLARENEMATIVTPGMAMPHARLEGITDLVVGVATCADGIVFVPRRPGSLVKLIVLTLAPKAAPGAYLQMLGSLATICRDPATPDIVASLPTAEAVWAFFDKGGPA